MFWGFPFKEIHGSPISWHREKTKVQPDEQSLGQGLKRISSENAKVVPAMLRRSSVEEARQSEVVKANHAPPIEARAR